MKYTCDEISQKEIYTRGGTLATDTDVATKKTDRFKEALNRRIQDIEEIGDIHQWACDYEEELELALRIADRLERSKISGGMLDRLHVLISGDPEGYDIKQQDWYEDIIYSIFRELIAEEEK